MNAVTPALTPTPAPAPAPAPTPALPSAASAPSAVGEAGHGASPEDASAQFDAAFAAALHGTPACRDTNQVGDHAKRLAPGEGGPLVAAPAAMLIAGALEGTAATEPGTVADTSTDGPMTPAAYPVMSALGLACPPMQPAPSTPPTALAEVDIVPAAALTGPAAQATNGIHASQAVDGLGRPFQATSASTGSVVSAEGDESLTVAVPLGTSTGDGDAADDDGANAHLPARRPTVALDDRTSSGVPTEASGPVVDDAMAASSGLRGANAVRGTQSAAAAQPTPSTQGVAGGHLLPTVTVSPLTAAAPVSAAIATPTPLSQAPGASAWPPHEQVMTAVSPLLRRADGSYSIAINLEPEHLGRVTLQIQVRAGEVAVTMQAADASAREMLRDNLSSLRQQLEQQGMKAGQLDVHDGFSFARQFQSSQGGGGFADGRMGAHHPAGTGSDEQSSSEHDLRESNVVMSAGSNALDLQM